jgi:hypothetical protein
MSEEIMTENFWNQWKVKPQILEAQRTPNVIHTKERTAQHIIDKLMKTKIKEKTL